MARVTRRHVLYIPGFDPVPPRAYRERYRREAARQAQISGYVVEHGEPPEGVRFGWHVDAVVEGEEVAVDLEVLYWADLVRAQMRGGVAATYWALLRTAWIYVSSGALWRLMRLRKGPVIAALYPVLVLLGQLVLAGVGALALGAVITWLGGRAGFEEIMVGPAYGAGLVLGIAFLRWCAGRDHFYAWYLMKDYAFASSLRGAYPPDQAARMAAFADRIAEVLQGDADEVLVVGHSSGASIAVSVLADLIRAGRVPEGGPILSLLTLGQVVPMVSFLPEARRLRGDLALMSGADVPWVDVSAPGDGCSFALCDPVAVTGVAPEGQRWPLVVSAAFTQTLSEAARAGLKWRLFDLHFQYLNAFDALPEGRDAYEYFRVTLGPMTLWERFGARAPSGSRIARTVNRYTDIAP
ncbi:hypothetical protein [Gymnodinialimonas ulvae]|uniref:hypothetical protein n=1 Tax=Gymnodinialimonas ulvae TaxID=3126504 RepID=UPI0030ABFA53